MAKARNGSWPVVAMNGVVAVVVLAVVAVLALVVNPPAPPGIAAFAPQASKPITKAPQEQSSVSGEGPAACAAGQVCASAAPTTPPPSAGPSPTASPTPLRGAAPAGLACVEWPDGSVTQTFDPQSPVCIARWDDTKGNGGATWQGVTGSEIRVTLPVGAPTSWPQMKPIVDFFNSRYQLYGRQVTIVPVESQQSAGTTSGDNNNPSSQRADAAAIAAQKPFATLDFLDPVPQSWTLPGFLDEMVKKRIVSVNGGDVTPYGTAADLKRRSPYVWSYYPTIDQVMDQTSLVICRQLVGRPASHAPDEALRGSTRKLALLFPTDETAGGGVPGLSAMVTALKGCGVPDPKVVRWQFGAQNSGAMSAAMQQLRDDGVTSLVYLPFGGQGTAFSPMAIANNVGFRPEWVIPGWNNYNAAFLLAEPHEEAAGAFGVGSWNKHPQISQEPWYQAYLSTGGTAGEAKSLTPARGFYEELQLLFSGIQLAGPRLTPETFAAGLQSPSFPNPGAGAPPTYQGRVGFEDGDRVMVDDWNLFWLDVRTTGNEVTGSPGLNQYKAMCYVGLGRRWAPGAWPTRDRFYEPGACR